MHKPDVPVRVAINEAIEIARRFATEDSAKFVNGVLDRIARSVRAETPRPLPPPNSNPDSWPASSKNSSSAFTQARH